MKILLMITFKPGNGKIGLIYPRRNLWKLFKEFSGRITRRKKFLSGSVGNPM